MKHRLILFFLRTILWRFVLLWCKTLRIKKINNQKFDEICEKHQPCVIAFWHGSMLVGWFLHRPKNDVVSALASQSNDGEYLSTVLERWRYSVIRGSSHIGGKKAMQLMTEAVTSGSSVCITPDGPRGPRHEMKMGAVRLAQKTQTPLILVGIALKKKKQLRSWDLFEVPMSFTRVTTYYSDPIIVPRELQGTALDELKFSVEQQLRMLTQQAEIMM